MYGCMHSDVHSKNENARQQLNPQIDKINLMAALSNRDEIRQQTGTTFTKK